MKRTALYNMIEQQIRPWDVYNPALLEALNDIPRENFLPSELRPFAYMDTELSLIIDGKDTGTKLMPPRLLARIVQELDLQGTENVALVGLGDGYLAALLAKFSRTVTVYEINEDILHFAQDNLNQANIQNVNYELADGLQASSDKFDVVVLAGSITRLTPALLNKIVVGGQLFAIVGQAGMPTMSALLVTRTDEQAWSQKVLFETVLPPLKEKENKASTAQTAIATPMNSTSSSFKF